MAGNQADDTVTRKVTVFTFKVVVRGGVADAYDDEVDRAEFDLQETFQTDDVLCVGRKVEAAVVDEQDRNEALVDRAQDLIHEGPEALRAVFGVGAFADLDLDAYSDEELWRIYREHCLRPEER